MSPHYSNFLKKPPLSNLSSNCSESVLVTIKIIKHKTQSAKPVGLTPPWDSVFRFCRGIFTGDNYSPIIFNLVFQPLIDFIKLEKDKQGYALGNSRVITKPFADDFEIISNNTKRHQELQDKVQLNATTMGLTFKPKKCRTLSLHLSAIPH